MRGIHRSSSPAKPRLHERGALWVRDHPKVTAAIGGAAATAATIYGGPLAGAAAGKALPFLCNVLRLCA